MYCKVIDRFQVNLDDGIVVNIFYPLSQLLNGS